MKQRLAAGVALVLVVLSSGCAGAYVAGDVGANRNPHLGAVAAPAHGADR
jgi:hypothetical protein